MATYDIETFLALESAVWEALTIGDAAADGRLLADDFLGVYSTGFAGKAEHVGQLAGGPTVARFRLADATLRVLAEGLVLLAYRAEWERPPGGDHERTRITYITSIWRETAGRWRNVFSQDTDAT